MSYHGIAESTYKKFLVDAGQVRMNYVDADDPGILIGATRGGNSFTVEPEYHRAMIDGPKGYVKGDTRFQSVKCSLKINMIEIEHWIIAMSIPGSTTEETPISAPTHKQIKRALVLLLSDYKTNIALIGEVSGYELPLIFIIKNALADGGFKIDLLDNDESVLMIQFTAHFDPSDLVQEPFEIRNPTIAIDFSWENTEGSIVSFTPIITGGDVEVYDWDFGDGSARSNEMEPVHDYDL